MLVTKQVARMRCANQRTRGCFSIQDPPGCSRTQHPPRHVHMAMRSIDLPRSKQTAAITALALCYHSWRARLATRQLLSLTDRLDISPSGRRKLRREVPTLMVVELLHFTPYQHITSSSTHCSIVNRANLRRKLHSQSLTQHMVQHPFKMQLGLDIPAGLSKSKKLSFPGGGW